MRNVAIRRLPARLVGGAEKHHNSGFTLAEMLVTVGVFAIAMSVSSSIFINVNNLQQQTANMGKLQNEGRYIMEKLGKEIRGRELDYAAMQPYIDQVTGETDILIFKKDEAGEVYTISFSAPAITVSVNSDTESKQASLNAEEVIVEKLRFRVAPLADPYEAGAVNPPLEQPRVTMTMVIKNGGNVPDKYRKSLRLQTTISSKVYK